MQLIGLGTAVFYLAALTFFMVAFFNPEWATTGSILGAVCFVVASLILYIMIKQRAKTERI